LRYLLDANTIILALTGAHPLLRQRIGEREEGEVITSAIAFTEVAHGSARGKPRAFGRLQAFVNEIPVLDFDFAAARAYAALPFKRGSFDRLIAAHALSIGATVVTSNRADFADVPGLAVEDWTA